MIKTKGTLSMSEPNQESENYDYLAEIIEQFWKQLTLKEKLKILQESGFEFDSE